MQRGLSQYAPPDLKIIVKSLNDILAWPLHMKKMFIYNLVMNSNFLVLLDVKIKPYITNLFLQNVKDSSDEEDNED